MLRGVGIAVPPSRAAMVAPHRVEPCCHDRRPFARTVKEFPDVLDADH
nr:hypothetical protein [Kibdelosporangium sp. MJ126-NF4]